MTSLPSRSVLDQAVMKIPACQTLAPCNTAACSGWNQAIDFSFGACGSGDCTGFCCTKICLQGDFQGCDCVAGSYCPSTHPTCDIYLGTSYTNGTGVCGPGLFAACPCKQNCPSTKVPYSADGCSGMNEPHGSDGVCLGCDCQAVCQSNGPCNLLGNAGINNGTPHIVTCRAFAWSGRVHHWLAPIDRCTGLVLDLLTNGCASATHKVATDANPRLSPCDSRRPISLEPPCVEPRYEGLGATCATGNLIGCDCVK
jgi:hypothetical protein